MADQAYGARPATASPGRTLTASPPGVSWCDWKRDKRAGAVCNGRGARKALLLTEEDKARLRHARPIVRAGVIALALAAQVLSLSSSLGSIRAQEPPAPDPTVTDTSSRNRLIATRRPASPRPTPKRVARRNSAARAAERVAKRGEPPKPVQSPPVAMAVPVATVAEAVSLPRGEDTGNPWVSGVIGGMTALVLWFAYRRRPRRPHDERTAGDAHGSRHRLTEARAAAEFERLVQWLYARDGYGVSRVGAAADEGIDFVLTSGDARDVVRCSRAGGTVDAAAVREFYGAMLHVRARHGFIVTTSRFTASAQGATANIPITLIDGQTLLSWIDGTFNAAKLAAIEPTFDAYVELQVARDATEPQIKAAYRSMMGQYHPDRVAHLAPEIQGFAKRKAQAINRAYNSLRRANGWR